jgi:ubiquinone/menaquinone biosynthesis C-methylase UbiE
MSQVGRSRYPHYVRDYRQLVDDLVRTHDLDTAMSLAVGGAYEAIGASELAILKHCGLPDSARVIDVGCGSGRLASALRDRPAIRYLGTDVVPELLDYAKTRCNRPDWRFVLVEGLQIPADDQTADVVTFFSVFTHLTAHESAAYLAEAKRVLKPGGKIIASFIDPFAMSRAFVIRVLRGRFIRWRSGKGILSVVTSKYRMRHLGKRIGRSAEFLGPQWLGQNVCVYQRCSGTNN